VRYTAPRLLGGHLSDRNWFSHSEEGGGEAGVFSSGRKEGREGGEQSDTCAQVSKLKLLKRDWGTTRQTEWGSKLRRFAPSSAKEREKTTKKGGVNTRVKNRRDDTKGRIDVKGVGKTALTEGKEKERCEDFYVGNFRYGVCFPLTATGEKKK